MLRLKNSTSELNIPSKSKVEKYYNIILYYYIIENIILFDGKFSIYSSKFEIFYKNHFSLF